ncbi:MAG: hypothetical protein KA335_00440 [Ramlibacter sp.]|jgi:hypothetical protein|nr:hypothetical protein [Ramlibacter sp.]
MSALIDELKTRARLRLNAARHAGDGQPRLRDCLTRVARDAGFVHWDHARLVLGGLAAPGSDMGTFWHTHGTGVLLNQWFARVDEARAVQQADPGAFLLPYRRQFMLVQDDFIREIGCDPAHPAWRELSRDAVRGYASAAWTAVAMQRLRTVRSWASSS